MDRTFAANYTINNGKRTYQNRDVANGISGTSLDAEDRTKVEEELIGGIIEEAGLEPDRTDLGQVNKALAIMYAAYERGIAPYSSDVAKRIGGYPLNAVVCDAKSPAVFWRSTADKNMTIPGADGASWTGLLDGVATEEWATEKFQTALGFTPVQQGGGVGQNPNKIYLGWAVDGSGLKCTIDLTDQGNVALTGLVNTFRKAQVINGAGYTNSAVKWADGLGIYNAASTTGKQFTNFWPEQRISDGQRYTVLQVGDTDLDVRYLFDEAGNISGPHGQLALTAELPAYVVVESINPNTYAVAGSVSFTAPRAGFLVYNINAANDGPHGIDGSKTNINASGTSGTRGGANTGTTAMFVGNYVFTFEAGAAVTIDAEIFFTGSSANNILYATGLICYD